MKLQKQTIIIFIVLVIVSTLVKILCAPQINFSGFTAVIAVSLFAGLAINNKKIAFLFPLLTLFVSDALLQLLHSVNLFPYEGFYSGQIINYILFFLLTLVGMACRNFKSGGTVTAALIGPTVFFLLSNFFVWKFQAGIMGYSKDINGLWQSYTFGLPFYKNSLISTLIFLPLFIALHNRIAYGKFNLAYYQ